MNQQSWRLCTVHSIFTELFFVKLCIALTKKRQALHMRTRNREHVHDTVLSISNLGPEKSQSFWPTKCSTVASLEIVFATNKWRSPVYLSSSMLHNVLFVATRLSFTLSNSQRSKQMWHIFVQRYIPNKTTSEHLHTFEWRASSFLWYFDAIFMENDICDYFLTEIMKSCIVITFTKQPTLNWLDKRKNREEKPWDQFFKSRSACTSIDRLFVHVHPCCRCAILYQKRTNSR